MLQFKYHHVTESHDCDKGQSGITFDQLRTFVFQNSKDIRFLHVILCELKNERADCEVTTEILAESERVGETGIWRHCSFIVVRVALIGIVIV